MTHLPHDGDPPYVPIRHTRWPTRRAPRWALPAAALVVAGAVLVGLVHRPSTAQRASDLRAFLSDMRTDIESCAGGVSESLTALRDINSGVSHDRATAVSIATTGSANCSPANNSQLVDLDEYQVNESLASFNLGRVVNGLVTWAAPDAQNAQNDVARVLQAGNPQAKRAATSALDRALAKLRTQRRAVDAIIEAAIRALSARAKPPYLPG